MMSLIMARIRFTVLGFRGNGFRGLEQSFSGDKMLTNGACTKMARQTCQGHHQRPSKVNRRFESIRSGVVRTLGTSGSHIERTGKSTCPADSVNEDVCCARTFIGFL